MSGRPERLRALIAEEIRRQGSVSFERFMERALYEPGLGYYVAGAGKRGPGVDFRTSPGVGGTFARLLAVQVEECWRRLGSPEDFAVVEFGAGALTLARGLLEALGKAGAWPRGGSYLAVEPHAAAEAEAFGIRRVPEPEALQALRGAPALVLSNEFVDALPVRRFVIRSGRPLEMRVGLRSAAAEEDAVFTDLECEIREPDLREALGSLPALPEGFQLELNLRARRWMEEVGRALSRGYVLTLDYGYRRTERFRPERAAGTLLAYGRHRAEHDLYARVGEQDLTSHADFDDLIDAGRRSGLELLGLCEQMRFLTSLARRVGILEGEPADREEWRQRLAFKELIRPGGMGTSFRVLAQAKGATGTPLAGLIDPFASAPPA
jgi:SAM-dependent MidA family methyltransferase